VNTGQFILTVVTAVAAMAAAVLSWWAGYQGTRRERQARREEWWRRFQWATELATSGDDGKARVGLSLLAALTDSPLATPDELDALSSVSGDIVETYLAPLQQIGDDGRGGDTVVTDPTPEEAHDDNPDTADRVDGRPTASED
jgi:hypothetical protein